MPAVYSFHVIVKAMAIYLAHNLSARHRLHPTAFGVSVFEDPTTYI